MKKLDSTQVEKELGAPYDCSKPGTPLHPMTDVDLAESYGLGRPGSEKARIDPGVVRNPHGFMGK
ncbi:hypothetical protein KW807_01645 [Candidatus Parcubacteria bacterium]|nr:hypothetical protein [Candidatus Parcubacteria bacterium]